MHILHLGNSLPPPTEFEEGDLFVLIPAQELYLRSGGAWVLIGSTAVSTAVFDGVNIGGAPGEVFSSKVGTVLEFRTIGNTDGNLQIVTTGGVVNIDLDAAFVSSLVTDAQNLGAGARWFAGKVGDILQFRTLTSSDGSVVITEGADEVDIIVDPTAAGLVTGAQSLSNDEDIYVGNIGGVLQFRGIANDGGGAGIVTGSDTNDVYIASLANQPSGDARVFAGITGGEARFRRITGGTGINVTENADDIVIDRVGAFSGYSQTQVIYSYTDSTDITIDSSTYYFSIVSATNVTLDDFVVTVPAGAMVSVDLIAYAIVTLSESDPATTRLSISINDLGIASSTGYSSVVYTAGSTSPEFRDVDASTYVRVQLMGQTAPEWLSADTNVSALRSAIRGTPSPDVGATYYTRSISAGCTIETGGNVTVTSRTFFIVANVRYVI